MYAVVLQDYAILALDHDRFMEILHGKAFGVVIAVFGLGQVFGEKGMWQMAIHAPGHMVMTGFLPGVVLRCHDVTVCTGRRIGAEIGEPFCILEGERAHPDQEADQACNYLDLSLS